MTSLLATAFPPQSPALKLMRRLKPIPCHTIQIIAKIMSMEGIGREKMDEHDKFIAGMVDRSQYCMPLAS